MCYLCSHDILFLPVPSLWFASGGNVCQFNIFFKITMSKQASVEVEKGGGKNPIPTTNT